LDRSSHAVAEAPNRSGLESRSGPRHRHRLQPRRVALPANVDRARGLCGIARTRTIGAEVVPVRDDHAFLERCGCSAAVRTRFPRIRGTEISLRHAPMSAAPSSLRAATRLRDS